MNNPYEVLIIWLENAIERSDRITSGNLSHNSNALKGFLFRCAEYLKKHPEEFKIGKYRNLIDLFNYLGDKTSNLTTGNYSHGIANIKCSCNIWIALLNKYKENG